MEVRIIEVNGKVYTELKIPKKEYKYFKFSDEVKLYKESSRYRYYRVLGDLLNGPKEDKNNVR